MKSAEGKERSEEERRLFVVSIGIVNLATRAMMDRRGYAQLLRNILGLYKWCVVKILLSPTGSARSSLLCHL